MHTFIPIYYGQEKCVIISTLNFHACSVGDRLVVSVSEVTWKDCYGFSLPVTILSCGSSFYLSKTSPILSRAITYTGFYFLFKKFFNFM